MGSDSIVGVIALALVTAGFLVFAAIELGGLALPNWHTVSWLSHHYPPLRIAILAAILAFGVWWWLHSGGDIPK